MPGVSSRLLGCPRGSRACLPSTFIVTRRSSERLRGKSKVMGNGSGQQHDSGAVTNENVDAWEGRMHVEIANRHSDLEPFVFVEERGWRMGDGGWRMENGE
jgi:hypothetical protein